MRIFNSSMEQIEIHARIEPGRFSTKYKHISSRKISKVEKGAAWLLGRAALIGNHTDKWAQAMLKARGIQGVRVLVGLLSLTHHYSSDHIDTACEIALSHDAFRLKTIRQLIKRGGSKQEEFEFIDEHPIIRKMADYEAIAKGSIQH